MECVIKKRTFSRGKVIKLSIFLAYFFAAFAFISIGLQPAKTAEKVYAAEAETATSTLEIPAINLVAPVKNVQQIGKELEVPQQIAGAFSSHTNKTLIIGHSSTIFKSLSDLKLAQTFTYQSKTFLIKSIDIMAKEDISMRKILQEERTETIVLMTCSGDPIPGTNGDHTHRLIIYAELVK